MNFTSSARAVLAIATIAAGVGIAAPAAAQVNMSVGQPGFYGQLNIGGYPPPVLYSPQPVVVERRFVGAPVYLRVPEGHRRHWAKNCYRYNACGRQVYFVQDSWYTNTYAPRYREHYRPVARENFYREPHREFRNDHRNDYRDGRRDDHGGRGHDRGHDDRGDRGHGNGNGHGNGHGNGNGHGRHGD